MDAEWRTELAGEPVHLLGARALYRPQARALLIADLHLGKGDAFRRAGLAIPGGGTAHDLQRLDALLALCPSDVLWILGDLLHGPPPRAHWLAAWHAWREGHREIGRASCRERVQNSVEDGKRNTMAE